MTEQNNLETARERNLAYLQAILPAYSHLHEEILENIKNPEVFLEKTIHQKPINCRSIVNIASKSWDEPSDWLRGVAHSYLRQCQDSIVIVHAPKHLRKLHPEEVIEIDRQIIFVVDSQIEPIRITNSWTGTNGSGSVNMLAKAAHDIWCFYEAQSYFHEKLCRSRNGRPKAHFLTETIDIELSRLEQRGITNQEAYYCHDHDCWHLRTKRA